MNLESRLKELEKDAGQVNNCPECKDYNSAAHFARALIRSGKHWSETEIPEYRCSTCGKVPTRTDKEKQGDYSSMIVDLHAGRPVWGFETNEQ